MRSIAIVVEGQTEEAFVRDLLTTHLESFETYAQPVVVCTSRAAGGAKRKGGGTWKHYRRDIDNLLPSTNYSLVTTLLDFYAYPSDGPGADCASPHVPRACADHRETAMAATINNPRFVPFVMLHEFETLIFAAALGRQSLLGSDEFVTCLRHHAASVNNDIELLDDSPVTSPSKRVLRCRPDYTKAIDGVAAVAEVGDLRAISQAMPRFAAWLSRLEQATAPLG
ncbi:MAG: DUF4276 family protein [Dermatophilaceae bacterium]